MKLLCESLFLKTMARVREATRGEILRAAQKDATYLEEVESKVKCLDLNATLHANLGCFCEYKEQGCAGRSFFQRGGA